MLKYVVFWAAVAGVPVLASVLSLNRRWIRWAFFGMVTGLCLLDKTAINFFSHELYRGTSRGMEISLIHLLGLAVLCALAIRGKWQRAFPEGGIRLYGLYLLLCLPGLFNADSALIGWLETWKLMLLFLFWHAVYDYLEATGDVRTLVQALAVFVIVNALQVASQHYGGMYQAKGVFPHRNGMAMAMNLLGPVFLAGYLQLGLRDRLGQLCGLAFAGAALSSMWSYSRGAIAVVPVGYGLAVFGSLVGARRGFGRVAARLVPVALAGVMGLAAIWPHLVARFTVDEDSRTKQASKDTRVLLAHCAWEMMKEHPWAGVGINNWSLNLGENHPYQERVEAKTGRKLQFTGIVETVYLLVGAECGIPALLAMLAWFAWHWFACLRMAVRLRGTMWRFVPVGLLGGLSAAYLQSVLEWVLRQKTVMFLLVFCFALAAHLRTARPPKEGVEAA